MTLTKFTIFAFILAITVNGYAVRNPAGNVREPASAGQRSLYRSPTPDINSGNLVVTGNVGSGKHFRGVVPYNSVSDFSAPLGSGTFDDFRRRSSTSGIPSNVGQGYRPYYFDSSTVTRIDRSQPNRILRAPEPIIDNRINDMIDPQTFYSTGINDTLTDVQTVKPSARPLSFTQQQMEENLAAELENIAQQVDFSDETKKLTDEEYRKQLNRLMDKTEELKEELLAKDKQEAEELQTAKKFRQEEMAEPEEDEQQPDELQDPLDDTSDVYMQMRRQVQELLEETGKAEKIRKEKPDLYDKDPVFKRSGEKELGENQKQPEPQDRQEKDFIQQIEEISMSVAKARTIMGEHQTFASYSKDNFNKKMLAAEVFMKNGQYYRAADSYTLATIYKSGDPLAYAGKAHALFAAGEYMSSALFLKRAIGIYPEYAALNIDIENMIGDRDVIESRLLEIEDLYENYGKSPELMFLAAYIYHNIDRPQKALESIDKAYEDMQDIPEVKLLRDVIYAAQK